MRCGVYSGKLGMGADVNGWLIMCCGGIVVASCMRCALWELCFFFVEWELGVGFGWCCRCGLNGCGIVLCGRMGEVKWEGGV